jgi:hypothetical protein
VARKKFSVSYEPRPGTPDVIETLKALKNQAGSRYEGRSLADIAGMILAQYALVELESSPSQSGKSADADTR